MDSDPREINDKLKRYYEQVLKDKKELKVTACTYNEKLPQYLTDIISTIEPNVLDRSYGCNSPIPPVLEGCTVLDLGCGSGRDVFVCSKLVGERGGVIGVDLTDGHIEVAHRYEKQQALRFGYTKPNTTFLKGYLEDLAAIGIEDNSIDVVISNCVINLSPEKERIFSEIFRVLKPGGELYFSNIFADRRISDELQYDPLLMSECLGGAMYGEDFRRMMSRIGVADYRLVNSRSISLASKTIEEKVGNVCFYSKTIRAFKLADLEDRCEDYGQVAYYLRTIEHAPHSFALDDHHEFFTNKPMLVCGNTAAMVSDTRFGRHFRVDGDREVHLGPFAC